MIRHIHYILSFPFFFNTIRTYVAGDQHKTKMFVYSVLRKYHVKTVLDFGCGTGDFSQAIPKHIKYLGVDLNEKYIVYAQKKYRSQEKNFMIQNVIDQAFYKNKKFDAILLISMLHHLSDDELCLILPVLRKITRKVIVVADLIPNPDGILRKLMVKLDQGRFIRTPEEKIKTLQKYFKVVYTDTIPSRLAIQFGIICEV